MNTRSSKLTEAEFRDLFNSRAIWYDDIIDLMYLMYRFGWLQAYKANKAEKAKSAREEYKRDRINHLRGYVKALSDCGYWAPETWAFRVDNAKAELASLESEDL